MDAIDELRAGGSYEPQVTALRTRILLQGDEIADLKREVRELKGRLARAQEELLRLKRHGTCPHCHQRTRPDPPAAQKKKRGAR